MATTAPRARRTIAAAPSADAPAAADTTTSSDDDASNVTHIDGASEIVEATEGEKISLQPPQQVAAASSDVCTAVVPHAFTLTRDDGAVIKYEAGTCEMPTADASHWFARAQGVKIYKV